MFNRKYMEIHLHSWPFSSQPYESAKWNSSTPWKINMEPENTNPEEEHHLPKHHLQVLWCSMLNDGVLGLAASNSVLQHKDEHKIMVCSSSGVYSSARKFYSFPSVSACHSSRSWFHSLHAYTIATGPDTRKGKTLKPFFPKMWSEITEKH